MIGAMRIVRTTAKVLMVLAVFAAVLVGCFLVLVTGAAPDPAFSCTEAGVTRTQQISGEIADELGGAHPVSSAGHGLSHGCDSTPNGVYDFTAIGRDAIAAAFGCRPDESLAEGWKRCSAAHGPFSLSAETATIEVLP
jgi:hypothetical protein